MKKIFLISFCILITTTMCMSHYSDWRRKPRKLPRRWCHCNHAENPPNPNKPPVHHDDPDNDVCKPYDPPMPDFTKPGQRISTTKCHEYIWQVKVRVERAEREKLCQNLKKKHHISKRETKFNISIDLDELFSKPVVPKDIFEPVEFIIGGRDVRSKEFPHMGAIGWKSSDPKRDWKFMCGSTLVSPKYVLTAAHCISADPRDTAIKDIKPKIVRFGVVDLISGDEDHSAEDRNISKTIPHPKYKSPLKYYDIALFELDRPLTFNKYIQPACLWTGDMSKVKKGTVTGWGVTNPDDHEGHPYLQAAELDVIDSKRCDDLMYQNYNRRWPRLVDYQFCAGQMTGGVDACQGDSGGPFQQKIPLPRQVARQEGNMYYIIGVTSFGIGCGLKDVPGIYIEVASFLDFIEQIAWS